MNSSWRRRRIEKQRRRAARRRRGDNSDVGGAAFELATDSGFRFLLRVITFPFRLIFRLFD